MIPTILKTGCYYIRFRPAARHPDIDHYDGVLRVTREDADGRIVKDTDPAAVIKASADLYSHHRDANHYPIEDPIFEEYKALPPGEKGVPFFPRSMYTHYLLGTEVRENVPESRHVMLRFKVHRYDRAASDCREAGTCLLVLKQGPDDPTNVQPGDALPDDTKVDGEFRDQDFHELLGNGNLFLRGDVYDEQAGTVRGNLQAAFITSTLREAHVEIDCVTDVSGNKLPAPINNRDIVDWQDAFHDTGWDVTCLPDEASEIQIPPPAPGDPPGSPEGMWYLAEIHQVMLKWREVLNLNHARRWDYYLLCVQNIHGYDRGVSFDDGVDMDSVPDQIVALGADWKFSSDAKWNTWKGDPLKETSGYFRTSVHEMGHAMGLGHNHDDNGFMNTTDVIADSGVIKPPKIPGNILWEFNRRDKARLRHQPDVAVRPDMIYRGEHYLVQQDESGTAEGLQLHVRPHLEAVAYGAPVRVEFVLENTSKDDISAPSNFSLKSGHVFGKVIDPQGRQYRVQPVATRLDEEALEKLKPKEKRATCSLTLLRGPDGALFRVPGVHQVHVGLYWFDPVAKIHRTVWGYARVNVTAPVDDFHRVAALKLLGTPETLLNLAIGGDHLADGQKALDAALGDNILRPHVGVVECKRWLRRFHHYTVEGGFKDGKRCPLKIKIDRTRPADPLKGFGFIDRYTVCGIDEVFSLASLMDDLRQDEKLFTDEVQAEYTRVARILNERIEYFLAYGRIELGKDEATISKVRGLLQEPSVQHRPPPTSRAGRPKDSAPASPKK